MSRLFRWSKKGVRLVYKVRHHKGHGVHSPFVFNLINNVIEEKRPYYFYEDLPKYLELFGNQSFSLTKENRLIFRLVNYFGAKHILEVGSGSGINTLCLTAPSKKIKCITIEQDEQLVEFASRLYKGFEREIEQQTKLEELSEYHHFDCIYIDLNRYNHFQAGDFDRLVSLCHEKTFIVVKGIRQNRKQDKVWKRLSEHESRTAKLDLYHIGLLFFDKQLYRWSYQISF